MKKLIVLLTTALLVASLTACGSKDDDKNKENEHEDSDDVTLKYKDLDSETYVLDFNGMESTVVLYYDNDKVFAQTLLTEAPYSSFNLSTKEEAEEIMAPIAEQYQGIDGVIHEIDFDDDSLTETLSIDYELVNLEDLGEINGIIYDEDAKKNGVGFKATKATLLALGYEKK